MTTVEWPREKKNPTATGLWLCCIEFAGHVVDGCNMVGINSVPQAKAVGQKAQAQRGRVVPEERTGPLPRRRRSADQDERVDRNNPGPQGTVAAVLETGGDLFEHVPFSFSGRGTAAVL